jgi:hypothetical protein
VASASGLSSPELASLQSAIDFDQLLGSNNVGHHLCKVNSTQHATHLLTLYCNDDSTHIVRWNVVDWLGNNGICSDPLHPCIDLP